MKFIFLLSLPFFTAACSIFGARSVEEPKYDVLLKEDKFEIRNYNKMIIAKTFVEGNYEESTNKSFRKIADYIFGNNLANKEIAMTAPVVQEPKGEKIAMTAPVVQSKDEKGWYMYFIMPSNYDLQSLPKPKNPEVILEELPQHSVAVYTYSGFTSEDKLNNYTEKLKNWAEQKGYKVTSEARSARYNHPLTIPFLRTNEVQIDVKQ